MGETYPFTIEQFYRFVGEGKLMGAKCGRCGGIFVPPRPLCPKCQSRDLGWVQLKNRGKLLTYTVIHVAPEEFQQMTPYALGIIELEDGVRLPGIIRGVKHEDLRVGMTLEVDFDTANIPSKWPQWPRYFFRPTQTI
ncbi:MAG: Zn-ribbon domain-containing OB-fold protein [Candidatus Bathyarchaeia archaeon]|nr:Zn-ribbon domain-containing OB-fold protein [Candidatus Bathyarchaeota archaeon]